MKEKLQKCLTSYIINQNRTSLGWECFAAKYSGVADLYESCENVYALYIRTQCTIHNNINIEIGAFHILRHHFRGEGGFAK